MPDSSHRRRADPSWAGTTLGVVVLGLVAACSVGPGPSSTDTRTPTPSAAASAAVVTPAPRSQAVPTPTPAPSPTVAPSRPPLPTPTAPVLPHQDASLEALLPARIDDVPLVRFSTPGSDWENGGDICSFLCPREASLVAGSVGATADELAVAVAYDEPADQYVLKAFRVAGVTGLELRDGVISRFGSDAGYPIVAEERVGDDVVTVAVRSWFPNDTYFYVVRDDALIVIVYPTDVHEGTAAVLPDGVRDIVAALP